LIAHAAQRIRFLGNLLLLVAGSITLAVPPLRGQAGTAQNTAAAQAAAASAPAPVFDVAAIHLHKQMPHERSHIVDTNGRFITVNVSPKAIMQWAFDIPASRIAGGPEWVDSARFDIEAKAENSLDMSHTYDAGAAHLEKRRMVQALLADRFKLATHPETRELPIYTLVVSKNGPKFLDSQAHGTTINSGRDHIQIEGGDNTVALLAEQLAEVVGRVVIDKTAIQGRYSLTLKWTPEDAAPAPDSSEPSIFTAIQEQLGLKLEPQKGPVQVLVIDHIEAPSEN
jgi:uncharacterized protein (TIGR03435 family)